VDLRIELALLDRQWSTGTVGEELLVHALVETLDPAGGRR
jgi:hypothetical protein